jgi:hydrogenase expression/formation protein HypC
MCLAVPGKVLEIIGDDPLMKTGKVSFGGIVKEINLAFVPEAAVGSYVLVHAGFAINVIDEQEAAKVFEYLEEIDRLGGAQENGK